MACTRDIRCSASSHFSDCESMPSRPTTKAIRNCVEWLKFCLDIGWPKSSLDDLETIWWSYHDEMGQLKRSG
jgi:hypothetical protein